ncbi:hypothetical protein shim_12070 [Shimia sp. SK013]|uniref:hypothetical protein n=1 Tax=Shimia sp. SK013 TaxID=1389006 RepID=UPI0006CC9606|nr:hypothetical protein [Shimia sp. SK013]KPA22917.1 hypothetical protein shim_12070 [Shimia sp. SK013]
MSAVVKPQDVLKTLVLRQIVNGKPADTISVQSSGALQIPRVGESVEIDERSQGLKVAGTVSKVFFAGGLSSGGPSDPIFSVSAFVDVE